MKRFFQIFILVGFSMLTACNPRTNPNEWVLITSDCWNSMSVLEAGDAYPYFQWNICERSITLPATEMGADLHAGVRFKGRVEGEVDASYLWEIDYPKAFVNSAKKVVSTTGRGRNKVDVEVLEALENTIIDRIVKNKIREICTTILPKDIDELAMEVQVEEALKDSMAARGIVLSNVSLKFDLPEDAELAIALEATMGLFKSIGQLELGKQLMLAKASAPTIIVQK